MLFSNNKVVVSVHVYLTVGEWVQEVLEWVTWVLPMFLPAILMVKHRDDDFF